jgi:cytochrome c oxidase assembly protein Cox11
MSTSTSTTDRLKTLMEIQRMNAPTSKKKSSIISDMLVVIVILGIIFVVLCFAVGGVFDTFSFCKSKGKGGYSGAIPELEETEHEAIKKGHTLNVQCDSDDFNSAPYCFQPENQDIQPQLGSSDPRCCWLMTNTSFGESSTNGTCGAYQTPDITHWGYWENNWKWGPNDTVLNLCTPLMTKET